MTSCRKMDDAATPPQRPRKASALAVVVVVLALGAGAAVAFFLLRGHGGQRPSPSRSPLGPLTAAKDLRWGTGVLDSLAGHQPSAEACGKHCQASGALGANWDGSDCYCVPSSADQLDVANQACWSGAAGWTAMVPRNLMPKETATCVPGMLACRGRQVDKKYVVPPGAPFPNDPSGCLRECTKGSNKAVGAVVHADGSTCGCILPSWTADTGDVRGACLVPAESPGGDVAILSPADCALPQCAPKAPGQCTPDTTTDKYGNVSCGDFTTDSDHCAELAQATVLHRGWGIHQFAHDGCACRCQYPFLTTWEGDVNYAP